jgi:hypothetical protein
MRDELRYLMLASLPSTLSRFGFPLAAGATVDALQPTPACTKNGNYITSG